MSASIAAGLGAVGFLGGISNGRFSLFPVSDQQGRSVTGADGSQIFRAFDAYVAMQEEHFDEMHITDHPVAMGTTISDHAFRMPARLTVVMAWSPSDPAVNGNALQLFGVSLPTFTGFFQGPGAAASKLRSIYAQLLAAQQKITLMTVATGKRLYTNMLIQSVQENTNSETENVLVLTVVFREILRAKVTTITSPISPTAQAYPQVTSPPVDRGSVAPVPSTTGSAGAG